MFDLIADEPSRKKRREEYDAEDSIGLVNPRRRRGPDTGPSDDHELAPGEMALRGEVKKSNISHLPWNAPIADPVEKVAAPILWNGNILQLLIGLALTEDLKRSTLPMRTHPVETQSSRTCERAETRRFVGGQTFEIRPPIGGRGHVFPWTQHQSMNINVLKGLALYLRDATGGVIAIADDNPNTEYVLGNTVNQGVGGSSAAAQDDIENKTPIRFWVLNNDVRKNKDRFKYEDVGPHTSKELMDYFRLSSKDFSYGMETHGVNRFASNNQLMPYLVVAQRRHLAKCKAPDDWNTWFDWNQPLDPYHGHCFVELSLLELIGNEICHACSVDDMFISDGLKLLERHWLGAYNYMPDDYWRGNAKERAWKAALDEDTRKLLLCLPTPQCTLPMDCWVTATLGKRQQMETAFCKRTEVLAPRPVLHQRHCQGNTVQNLEPPLYQSGDGLRLLRLAFKETNVDFLGMASQRQQTKTTMLSHYLERPQRYTSWPRRLC